MMRRPRSALAAFVVIAAAVTGACTETSTAVSTTAADPISKCQVSLTAPSVVDAGGGTATVTVTTQPECAWNASTTVNWISGMSPASGQGTGTVGFRVAANDGTAAREADIRVNEGTVRVSQRAPCRFDIRPASQTIGAAAGGGSVTVAVASECAWSATTDANWIALSAPLSGSGNGTINFKLAGNSGAERSGSVLVGGQRSTVTQIGTASSPCSYTISSTSQNVGAAGGTGTPVAVSTQAGCLWTASSGAQWITITSGASGAGNGSVGFTVAANTGAARTAALTIAGHAFSVTQAAANAPACSYSISPNNQNVPALGGTGTVNVSSGAGCQWTAGSNASWIAIATGASGAGDGAVGFVVSPNTGGGRNGTLTVATKTFTVSQAAAAPCSYSISPGSQKVDGSGGTATVAVTAGSGCAWTASSNDSWITITAGSSGTGNGTVTIRVAANPGKDRKGTLTIAGKTATIEQKET
jgi:Putative binding domain, N-terminal/Viral BACON domain